VSLRREGLYFHQITAWRAEVIAHVETRPTPKKDARDETIRQLEREVVRKDNALAEASALLILQKKSTWGDEGASPQDHDQKRWTKHAVRLC
jgi:hypothetical protein